MASESHAHGDVVDEARRADLGGDGEQHGRELRDAYAPYVGAGRRAGRGAAAGGQRAAGRARRSRGGSNQVAEIRDWARKNGHQVNERGRIPGAVRQAYDAAH